MNTRKQVVVQIKGKSVSDERGTVGFVNDFTFKGVKRFYIVENKNTKYIRAFHGHFKESKYVYVVRGTILLCVVPIDDPKNPSKKVHVKRLKISDADTKVIFIPPGFANGFRSITPHAKVMFFSDRTLAQSLKDDFRFPAEYWGKRIWQLK